MKTWKLIALGIVFIILLGVAATQRSTSSPNLNSKIAEKTLLEGVDLNALTAIYIQKGEEVVKLAKRDDGKWFVISLYNYPVHQERLFTVLREMSEIKTGVPQRSGNVSLYEYGLEEMQALNIEFIAGDELVKRISVGKSRKSTNSNHPKDLSFLRVTGNEVIQLVEYKFGQVSEIGPAWTQREILSIESTNIVSVTTPDFELTKEDGKWILTNASEEEAEKLQQGQAERVAQALYSLHFTNVIHPRAPEEELGYNAEGARFYTAKTVDGKTITIKLGVDTHKGTVMKIEGDVDYRASDWVYTLPDSEGSRFIFSRDQLFVKIPERKNDGNGMGMSGMFQQFQ